MDHAALTLSTRLLYGLGQAAEGIKSNAFAAFLLFYYQQVLGLDATLCGLALFLALCVDAVSDPAVGWLSDGTVHRWGRRHPWMLAAPVPLSVSYLAVFHPPDLGQTGLFLWLTTFAIGTRLAMTAFSVPHSALGAELTADYDTRSGLMALRTGFGWVFGLLNAFLAYTVFLRGSEAQPNGLLLREGYSELAWFGAGVLVVATTASALGTLRQGRAEPIAVRPPLLDVLRSAMQLPAYRNVVVGGLLFATAFGLSENLVNYVNTLVWRLTPEQLGLFVFAIGGGTLVATAVAEPIAARIGKHRLAMLSTGIGIGVLQGAIALRGLGLVPDARTSWVLPVLLAAATVAYTGFVLTMSMLSAMIADCTDAFRAQTGDANAGALFAANTFLAKAVTGLGTIAAGQVVAVAGVTAGADPATVDPAAVTRLAGLSAGLGTVLGTSAILVWSGYDLDREALDQLG
jgi:GPH family glycoside/pentoside/hexuronide:cation symporter